MAALIPCMGGWCTRRDHCAHFNATNRKAPVERLCAPGHDGEGLTLPRAPLQQPVQWPELGLPKT